MTTKNNQKKEPLVMRLMLATIFLPVALLVIGLLLFAVTHEESVISDDKETLFGISTDLLFILCFIVLPLATPFVVAWTGRWRAVLIGYAIIILGMMVFMNDGQFVRVAPEDRLIVIYQPEGADVYCNDVLLGQAPMKISVRDLKAKVPVWTTPPDQDHYQYEAKPVYAYLPWDTFDHDRYEQYQALDVKDKKAIQKLDTTSKYWWKIERKGVRYHFTTQPDFYTNGYGRGKTFDHVTNYSLNYAYPRARTANELYDVLGLAYEHLNEKEKTLWCEYVLSLPSDCYFDLEIAVRNAFAANGRGKEQYKEAMRCVARMKYHFSENPNRAECYRILETLIAENRKTGAVDIVADLNFGGAGVSYRAQGVIPSYAIEQLSDNAIEPTRELLHRNWYDLQYAAPILISMTGNLKSPELFEDEVRYLAASDSSIDTVFANRDDRVLPLFRTIMADKTLYMRFNKESEIDSKIRAWTHIYDERLESYIRDEIAMLFANYRGYGNGFQSALTKFVLSRIRRDKAQRDELRQWVESLRVNQQIKDQVLSQIPMVFMSNPEFPMRMSEAVELSVVSSLNGVPADMYLNSDVIHWIKIGVDDDNDGELKVFTTTELLQWLDEHPEQGIEDYFAPFADYLPHMDMLSLTLGKLAFDARPEARKILKRYWDKPETKEIFLQSLRDIFTKYDALISNNRVPTSDDSFYVSDYYPPNHENFAFMQSYLFPNPVMVEFFNEVEDAELCRPFAHRAAFCGKYLPGLVTLLDKWIADSELGIWEGTRLEMPRLRKLEAIHTQSRELFLQIAAGKMTPDDLLPKPEAWTWQDGKYVKKTGE